MAALRVRPILLSALALIIADSPAPAATAAALTSACSTMNAANVFIDYSGPSSGCRPFNQTACVFGESLPFTASSFGYNFACAPHTFDWTFPGGVQKTGRDVTFAFTQSGTFTVSLTINNGAQIIVLTALVTVAAPSCADGAFTPLAPLLLLGVASDIAVADLDADQHPDLITAYPSDGVVRFQLGRGDGSFLEPSTYAVPFATDIAVGDVNGDGALDIVVSSEPGTSEQCISFGSCASYYVLLNRGDATFSVSAAAPVPFANTISAIDTADLDGDGRTDVLVVAPPLDPTTPNVHIFFGDGSGAFPRRVSWVVDGPVKHGLAVRLNGNQASPTAVIAVGPSPSSQQTRLLAYTVGAARVPLLRDSKDISTANWDIRLERGDVNGDGREDVAFNLARIDGGQTLWGSAVALGSPSSSLSSIAYYAYAPSPARVDVALGDIDEDGDLDAVSTSATSWRVFRWQALGYTNDNNGVTRERGSFTNANRVVTADVDRDALPDFIFLDASRVVVFRNVCSARFAAVSVATSPSPSPFATPITVTISVAGRAGAPIPTGTVTLTENSTNRGVATLDGSGKAVIIVSDLAIGAHPFVVTYSGDGKFASQTSSVYIHNVAVPPFGPPYNVVATGNGAAMEVSIRWNATADCASHDVLRKENGVWTVIAGGIQGESYSDASVETTSAYVYAVRSHSTSGAVSAVSVPDVATTATLALAADRIIRASDFLTTRTLIHSLRRAAGLPAFEFSDPSLLGLPVKALHMLELRTALNEARLALGLPAVAFVNATLTPGISVIQRDDISEIRNAFR